MGWASKLGFLLCLLTCSLWGHATHTLYCDRQEFCQLVNFTPNGEFLYVKPCALQDNYAIVTNGFPATITVLRPNYTVGFRAGLTASTDCWFVDLQTTAIDSTDTATSFGDVLIPQEPTTIFTFAEARLKYRFRAWRLRAGLRVFRCNWLTTWAFAGVPYMRFREIKRLRTNGGALPDEVFKFDGAGPEVGCRVSTCSFGGLKFHGLLAARAYIGPRRIVNPRTICFPAINLRWSASFTCPFGGPSITGELGYEILHFFELIQEENFGFWGPYARLEAQF